MLADHVVDQVLGRGRQHQAAHAADDHQHEADGQNPPARPHHLANVRPQFAEALGGAFLGILRGHCGLHYCMGCSCGAPLDARIPDAQLYSGTSGFAYPSWKPDFYPEKLPSKKFLSYYATRLNAVEVNYTFRRLPSASTLENWVSDTRPGFVFPLKAHMRITHIQRLKPSEFTEVFFRAIDPLRTARRLGPVLFQLPPAMKCDEALLAEFLATLPRDIRCAFEFRHASWLTDAVTACWRNMAWRCVWRNRRSW